MIWGKRRLIRAWLQGIKGLSVEERQEFLDRIRREAQTDRTFCDLLSIYEDLGSGEEADFFLAMVQAGIAAGGRVAEKMTVDERREKLKQARELIVTVNDYIEQYLVARRHEMGLVTVPVSVVDLQALSDLIDGYIEMLQEEVWHVVRSK